jgi:gliding motility-associated-like protein
MKYILFIAGLLISGVAMGQGTISFTSGTDTLRNRIDSLSCSVPCATVVAHAVPLNATTTYTLTSTPYAPYRFDSGATPTVLGASILTYDDNYGDTIYIPFCFSFFNNSYNKCVIGTNGNISFDMTNVNLYDPWPISGPLPGSNCTATEDCIMAPWNDLYPPNGGVIKYATYGTAPNRVFVISWDSVHLFISGTCAGNTSEQIVLHESTNIVDIFIRSRIPCTAWNNGYAVTGIENLAGTTYFNPAGENGTTFTATNEGWRFSPIGTATPWTLSWYDSTNTTLISSTDSITECPLSRSKYILRASNSLLCAPILDTLTYLKTSVGVGIDSTTFANPSSCLYSNGWILFHGIPPGDTITVTYTKNGAAVGPLTIYANSDSDLLFTSLGSGVYNNFIFKHDSCTFGPFGPYNLVAPPIAISHETFTNPSVCGECNGTITFYGLPPGFPITLTYEKGGVAQPSFSAVVGTDSTIHLMGLCAGVYTNFVANAGSCSANGTPITLTNPAPFPANFYLTTHLGCGGDAISVYNTSAPVGYNAYWNWGDGTPVDSSTAIPNSHLYNDSVLGYVATYTVTLTYESYHNAACATTKDTVVTFNHPISANFTSNTLAACVGVPINFTNTSIANGPSYLWEFGDGFSDTATNPSHAYATGGIYEVSLVTTDTIGCHSLPATETVTIVQVDIHTSTHDTSVCLYDSMQINSYALVQPVGAVSYYIYWTPTNNIGEDSSLAPKFWGIGNYSYTVNLVTTGPAVCSASDAETIHSYPPITLTNLTASPTIIPYGSSVQLNADGAVYYSWTPDNGTLSNLYVNDPVATPIDTSTTYTVYGMNLYGCLDSAKITVNTVVDRLEGLPSAFTPGEASNNIFRLTHMQYKKLVLFKIFNRWGEEVFSTNDVNMGWDGKYHGTPQDIGTYKYLIILEESDGLERTYKGDVTLIR